MTMAEWRDILRSTPMRLTLRLVVLFLAISLLTFAATWWLASRALMDATETTLDQNLAELSASRDADEIARAVEQAAANADPEHRLLRYEGPAGVVGNHPGPLPGKGLRRIAKPDDAQDLDGPYIVKTTEVAGGRLSVGESTENFDEMREVFIKILVFTLVPTILLVLAVGMLAARRSARRLSAIEATLARLTEGDLAARMPAFPGSPDDLSRVGSGINRLAVAQQTSVEALRQVSADIAHDLKTPIQRLSVQLVELRDTLPETVPVEALDRAEAEVAGIVETFRALLRIAQIEGGSPRTHFQPVDLTSLAATIAELYEPAAEESGHPLRVELGRSARVLGDRSLLGQVIANLIENALRHTPPDSQIVFRVDGGQVAITDNGPGIPQEQRDLVLRRLYRLDRSRSTPGNGLGLSLVEAVVKLHGGSLELKDGAPGLSVHITLPET